MSIFAKRDRQPPSSIVDEFIETYVSWREACEDVRMAYASWRNCPVPQRALGYGGYRAALDREEDAARVHCQVVQRVRSACAAG
jgi:hypothetical protein